MAPSNSYTLACLPTEDALLHRAPDGLMSHPGPIMAGFSLLADAANAERGGCRYSVFDLGSCGIPAGAATLQAGRQRERRIAVNTALLSILS